jgi:hypothetical protein
MGPHLVIYSLRPVAPIRCCKCYKGVIDKTACKVPKPASMCQRVESRVTAHIKELTKTLLMEDFRLKAPENINYKDPIKQSQHGRLRRKGCWL